jgi:hypothetical protein
LVQVAVLLMREVPEYEIQYKIQVVFGEDADFGMQLRNQGIGILCICLLSEILHLKAPIGGF